MTSQTRFVFSRAVDLKVVSPDSNPGDSVAEVRAMHDADASIKVRHTNEVAITSIGYQCRTLNVLPAKTERVTCRIRPKGRPRGQHAFQLPSLVRWASEKYPHNERC
jgi:hypothetical protein